MQRSLTRCRHDLSASAGDDESRQRGVLFDQVRHSKSIKSDACLEEHGFRFVDGLVIFAGPLLQKPDDGKDYGEPRIRTAGLIEGVPFMVVYTVRADAPSLATIRRYLKLPQKDIAALSGVPVATWRNWEKGRVRLDPAVRALLRVLLREPDAVRRAMAA
ncbi:hypothetical protein GLF_1788 [Gluconobacter frateurii NBRC 101659]|nr:hypothetical protein GLF_1788 [Gluconobacter frateurii NBRC 101659]